MIFKNISVFCLWLQNRIFIHSLSYFLYNVLAIYLYLPVCTWKNICSIEIEKFAQMKGGVIFKFAQLKCAHFFCIAGFLTLCFSNTTVLLFLISICLDSNSLYSVTCWLIRTEYILTEMV